MRIKASYPTYFHLLHHFVPIVFGLISGRSTDFRNLFSVGRERRWCKVVVHLFLEMLPFDETFFLGGFQAMVEHLLTKSYGWEGGQDAALAASSFMEL